MTNLEKKNQLTAKIRLQLLVKSDEDILKIALSLNREALNNQVPDEGFPAWDVANRIHTNHYDLSKGQRKALINVLSHYMSDKLQILQT